MQKRTYFHYFGLFLHLGVPPIFISKFVCRKLKKVAINRTLMCRETRLKTNAWFIHFSVLKTCELLLHHY